jgi:two-component system, NtrC family, nitrogen regulation sensor histidine kinase GlnL
MNAQSRHPMPAPQMVLDALPDPLVVLDDQDRICMVNSAAEDFFQAGSQILLRHGLTDLVPFASPVLQSVRQVRETASVVNEYAVGMGTPRLGGERIVDLQTAPLGENPQFVILLLLRRSVAQKLGHQLSHQGAARSVSGMAAMLAHEIKNPLAGIRGAAQLLEPSVNDADRSLTRLICDETDRISKLVDQMEVFSDERPLERLPLNIHVVLDHVKKLTLAATGKAVTIREEYDPSLPFVLGNSDQLVQVFLNLAKNAAEALRHDARSNEPAEILFTTAFRPGMKLQVAGSTERVSLPLEICVIDRGPGINEDLLPHIFEPFVTSKPQGRGLGLALVAKVVRDHGGTIECQVGRRGTTFRTLLPMILADIGHDEAQFGGIKP